MKTMIAMAGFFALSAAHADVFKCTDAASGKTVYQEKPCQTGAAEKVDIKAFDPNKIAEAQAKLAEQLKQAAEREAAAAEAARKERDLQAKEAIAAEARNQANAINRNTEALENTNQPATPLYYYMGPPVVVAPTPPPRGTPTPEPKPRPRGNDR